MTPLALPAVKRGDTWTLGFTVSQSVGGAPVDLTGCTAYLQLRHPQTEALVAAPDSIILTPLTGSVVATFLPVTTAIVPVGTYLTDLEILFSDGEVRSSQTLALPVLTDQTRP